jgi:hypothetical protein
MAQVATFQSGLCGFKVVYILRACMSVFDDPASLRGQSFGYALAPLDPLAEDSETFVEATRLSLFIGEDGIVNVSGPLKLYAPTDPIDCDEVPTFSKGNLFIRGVYESIYRDVIPTTNGTLNLGSVSKPWKDVYAKKFIGDSITLFGGIYARQFIIASNSGDSPAIGGITIQEEGTTVGNQLGITTVNFVGGSVTATSPVTGTANITITAASTAPAGSVIYHAASAAPTGYLKANGASLSTTTYATLFASIGYTFGGSGASFSVPDLRGEFVRGWDDARGVDSGRGFGAAQGDDFKSHTHNVNNQVANGPQWIGFSREDLNPSAISDGTAYDGAITSLGNDRIFYIVNTGGTETRPRNIALLACIKF